NPTGIDNSHTLQILASQVKFQTPMPYWITEECTPANGQTLPAQSNLIRIVSSGFAATGTIITPPLPTITLPSISHGMAMQRCDIYVYCGISPQEYWNNYGGLAAGPPSYIGFVASW